MRDIVDELRAMAKLWEERKMPWDETTLLHSAAGEIDRLRKVEGNPYKEILGGDGIHRLMCSEAGKSANKSFAEIVKDLKHHLRGESDG